jgi:gamma-glutamyltranspeptidase/glutathione hydrolase
MVYHVISNVIDHRMPLPQAIEAPRDHHQGLPDSLQVEGGGFLPVVLDSLRGRGHGILNSRYSWGDVEAIIRTPGGWQGVSDPRRGGGGAGY